MAEEVSIPEGSMTKKTSMIQEARRVCYKPGINIVQGSPIDIIATATANEYLDCGSSYLYIRAKLETAAGGIPAINVVAPVNNTLHSIWDSVQIELNGKSITGHGMHYAYRAYLENLLSFNPLTIEKNLDTEGFYYDTPAHINSVILANANENTELRKRTLMWNEGHEVELTGRLHSEIFHQEILLPPNVNMKLTLTPNKAKTCLITPAPANVNDPQPEFRVNIIDCHFYARKVQLYPDITLAQFKQHQTIPYEYPFRHIDSQFLTLGNGIATFSEMFHTNGQLPSRIIIGMISQNAHDGHYQHNPFNFQHFNLQNISLNVNGKVYPTTGQLTTDYTATQNKYLAAYNNTLHEVGILTTDRPFPIKYEHFRQGYALYAFDLTNEQTASSHNNVLIAGSCTLELVFRVALVNPIYVFLYQEFDRKLILDSSNTPIGPF